MHLELVLLWLASPLLRRSLLTVLACEILTSSCEAEQPLAPSASCTICCSTMPGMDFFLLIFPFLFLPYFIAYSIGGIRHLVE